MKFVTDYLDRKQCDTVKGFFILFVFASHFMQYVVKAGGKPINLILSQLMVAPFLFYSGFGVMESIKKKGRIYAFQMPKSRILATFVNFDIAVLAYLILNIALGNVLPLKQIALSFIGWESLGNSNWYIFIIILCYFVAFLAAILIKQNISIVVLVVSFVCMLALTFVRPWWWYSTILCFSAGMIYSEYREHVEKIVRLFYWPIFALLSVTVLLLMYRCPVVRGIGWNIKAVAFSLLIVLITMRFSIRIAMLEWCGQHLFPLYIYQRIPMIILFAIYPKGFTNVCMPVFFGVSLIVTILIANLYPKWHVNLR